MYQLHIEACPSAQVSMLSEHLEAVGACSVTLMDRFDDQILEPELGTLPLWPHVVIEALFEDKADALQQLHHLAQMYPELKMNLTTLPEEDWERTCLTDLKPLQFGKRLWICPSWLPIPDPSAVNLILDPGLAFGTGTHPTTALCLTWLSEATLHSHRIIDYGCGSGILALAALKLGATHAYAVDIDPQALIATTQNADNNHIRLDTLTCCTPNALQTAPVDLLMANILLTPLLALQSDFHALLVPGGQLVLSGLLASQTEQMLQTYTALFQHEATYLKEDWALMVFKKPLLTL